MAADAWDQQDAIRRTLRAKLHLSTTSEGTSSERAHSRNDEAPILHPIRDTMSDSRRVTMESERRQSSSPPSSSVTNQPERLIAIETALTRSQSGMDSLQRRSHFAEFLCCRSDDCEG